ncbi:MAG: hypothetical protein Q8R66_12155 [Methanobacteriaceae archaeon]|nr:hypothetical protein [Methanobacteriaceae archaeon]
MGFINNIIGFLSNDTNEVEAKRLLSNFGDIGGVAELVDLTLELEHSSVYKDLTYVDLDEINEPGVDTSEIEEIPPFIKYAAENIHKIPLRTNFTGIIGAKDVWLNLVFFDSLYFLRVGRKLTLDDYRLTTFSVLPVRLMFLLEDFDSSKETPEVTPDFFKKLGKLKWENKKAGKLNLAITDLRLNIMLTIWPGKDFAPVSLNEQAATQLWAGCSAVLDGRDRISVEDVLVGQRVYLKLVNCDVMKWL